MRVVVTVDGSGGSAAAARLVRAMAWPPDTRVQLLSVVDPGAWIPPGPGVPGRGGLVDEPEVEAYYRGQQLAISSEFAGAGLTVETTVVRGRPADAIVDEVRRMEADLVVVGSRGHGKIATLLLGSVSVAVVERAPCPVLVARRSTLGQVVLAVDGSSSARSAAQIAASWAAFAALPITVVAVAEAVRPWTVGVAPAFLSQAREAYAHEFRTASSAARQIAAEAVAGLRKAGRTASADVRRGQVQAQIIAAAEEHRADLVMIGCRGRSSLSTFLLGSVARDVVHASEASVLTVREATGR